MSLPKFLAIALALLTTGPSIVSAGHLPGMIRGGDSCGCQSGSVHARESIAYPSPAYSASAPMTHDYYPEIYGAGPGRSFLSGYEGLPNMDGGGIHYRYPYHSYRRPWAHPGPATTNISIVW